MKDETPDLKQKDLENPTAFPYFHAQDAGDKVEIKFAPGMTLRDYFAAAALTGLLARDNLPAKWMEFANGSYNFADAMLERRAK